MPWVALAAAGAAVIGGALASDASSDDRTAALNQNQAAVKAWLDVNVPDPEQQKVVLQRFVQQGTLSPELEQAVKLGQSEFSKIQSDPALRETRLKALSSLSDIGDNGGLTLSDQANLQKGLIDVAAGDRGRREAISDNMARRGISGSGLDMTAQLDSAQKATNLASQQQLDTLGSARARALQAIQGAGSLAGDISKEDYAQKANAATAADSIAAFNAKALQGVNHSNVEAKNAAAATNLKATQDIANANTGITNQQEIQSKGVYQQEFNNKAAKAAGLTGQYAQLGNAYNNAANRTAASGAGVGAGVAQGLSNYGALDAYLNKNKSDPNEETYTYDNDELEKKYFEY